MAGSDKPCSYSYSNSMSDLNPLAPPKCVEMLAGSAWRDGLLLVMTRNARLPNRCVFCNVTAIKHYRVILLGCEGGLFHRLRCLFVPKMGLCRTHYWQWTVRVLLWYPWLAVLFVLLGVVARLVGVYPPANPSNSDLFWAAVICLASLALAVWLLINALRTACFAMVRRAEGQFVWLSGVHGDLLAGLPQFPWTKATMKLRNDASGFSI
jgi:hypothetical protein